MSTAPAPSVDPAPLPRWCSTAAARSTIVAVATSIVLLVNLGSAPLWDDDEPKNTACTVSMLARSDWAVPRFNEALRSDKPPLVNWIQMAGFTLVGVNEAGARIGSALLTVATSLLVAATATRLFPSLPAVGLWSGLAMGTCAWSSVAGRAATPDAALCFCTTLALWFFVRSRSWGESTSRGTSLHHADWRGSAAVGVALGAAVLAKGPVGIVLPLAAVGAFAWWQAMRTAPPASPAETPVSRVRHAAAEAWRGVRPVIVVAAASLVAVPWYALVWHRTDGAWVRDFLLTHNMGRFSAPMEGHGGPPFYYLIVLLLGLFPWSIVAGVMTVDVVGRLRRASDAAPLRLLVAWAAVWVACFSLSGTKLPGYVWPAYPAVAIAIGWFLERWRLGFVAWADRWMPLAWGSLALAGVGFAVGLPVLVGILQVDGGRLAAITLGSVLASVGCVLLIAAWLAWREQSRGSRGASLGWLATGGSLAVAVFAAVAPDLVGRGVGVRPLVRSLAAPGTGEVVPPDWIPTAWSSYRCSVPGLVFYSGAASRGERVPRLAEPREAARFFADHPRGFLVAPASDAAELLAAGSGRHRVIARSKSLTRHGELVLIGPAGSDAGKSLAGRALEERVR